MDRNTHGPHFRTNIPFVNHGDKQLLYGKQDP